MLKRLAILGILVFGLVNNARPQDVGNGSKHEQPSQSKSDPNQVPSQPISQIKPYQWSDLYAPANMPNWALTLVAGWAGIMALMTLWAIRKQADIQAAGMKQWVDVQVINSDCELSYVLGGVALHAETIRIWFSASNQTPYPLTIEEVFVELSRRRSDGPKWEAYRKKEIIILSPSKDREPTVIGQKSIFDHHFYITLKLDDQLIEEYKSQKLAVSISGHVTFNPVIGPVESQSFAYLISCGLNNVHVLPLGSELEKGEETDIDI